MVPWKILVSAQVFIKFVTGLGIFMGTLVGIMLADYFFIRKGMLMRCFVILCC